MAARNFAAATDPLFAFVVSLLHFDGTNGSTTITDVIGHTWTVNGGADLTTANKKFGTASLDSDGNNDWINATDASFAPGTDDFCVEMWVRRAGNTATGFTGHLFDMRTAEPSVTPLIFVNGSGQTPSIATNYYVNGSSVIVSGTNSMDTTFRHLALDRSSGTTRLFIDGTQVGSDYADANDYTATTIYLAGRFADVSGDRRSWNGQIDDFRYTVGASRYTSNFTPPTSPFPNS